MSAAEVETRVWYYYLGNEDKQVGPITNADLKALLADGALSSDDYLYCDGYSDWKRISQIPEACAMLDRRQPPPPSPCDKRTSGKRVAIEELVVAHNDRRLASGVIKNISLNGVFLETTDVKAFSTGEEIKLTLKEGRGLGRPLNMKAVIMRVVVETSNGAGYGLELRGVDDETKRRIADYITRHQGKNR